MLPYGLYAYRTIVKTLIGVTPYSLVYSLEVGIPIEVEIFSLRILMEANFEDSE